MQRMLITMLALLAAGATAADRPNIVWLVTEDNSAHYLRLYEERGAPMPNVERLARGGLVFNNAFSCAPVCSVARSTIISGCYAPRVGTQYHRRDRFVPLPDGLRMFPSYLRRAGYYTTNNSKEDYNFIRDPEAWDVSSGKASYRNRPAGKPFFHVQNYGMTHEGSLHFSEADRKMPPAADPATIPVLPYHPDTPLFRYTAARYHDGHARADEAIGAFLRQLEEDGLMDDTIIFYYGDNGGVLPGSKGYISEDGVHIPMVVYIPEKWRRLAPAGAKAGGRVDGFVDFADLAPTVLNLAGAEIPAGMDGRPFLGKGVTLEELNARDTAFSYADRFDEKYDFVRALRKGKFRYLRSYQPFNFDGLYNFYRYKMLAYREWRRLYREGRLNDAQRRFFEPRPPEGLYDLERDPHEVNNLAGDPAYAEVLAELRAELQRRVKSMPDLSFYPECRFLEMGADNPTGFGQARRADIARLVDIADLQLKPFAAARDGLARALAAADPWERYWGLIACSAFGKEAEPFFAAARKLAASDDENLVRVRAAEFLGLAGAEDPRPVIKDALKRAGSAIEATLILNSVVLLTDGQPGYRFDLKAADLKPEWLKGKNSLVRERLDYLQQATP